MRLTQYVIKWTARQSRDRKPYLLVGGVMPEWTGSQRLALKFTSEDAAQAYLLKDADALADWLGFVAIVPAGKAVGS